MNEKIIGATHELKLLDRNLLSITGIKKIINFDSKEFILESIMGPIHIKGSSMELLSLDTGSGLIKIKGKIDSYNYIDKINKNKEESFISKLFKWHHLKYYFFFY